MRLITHLSKFSQFCWFFWVDKTEILPYCLSAAGQWHKEKQWDEDLIIMIFHNPYHKQFFSYKFWLGVIYKLCIAKDSLDGNYSDVVPRKPRATIAFCAKWINSNISIIITLLISWIFATALFGPYRRCFFAKFTENYPKFYAEKK